MFVLSQVCLLISHLPLECYIGARTQDFEEEAPAGCSSCSPSDRRHTPHHTRLDGSTGWSAYWRGSPAHGPTALTCKPAGIPGGKWNILQWVSCTPEQHHQGFHFLHSVISDARSPQPISVEMPVKGGCWQRTVMFVACCPCPFSL